MNIAIIDSVNQDIGLKILFPESDYYINNDEDCTRNHRINSYNHYNIKHNTDWTNITDEKYDYLFIILPVFDAIPEKIYFKENIYNIFNHITQIINNNNFKKVCIFDNYDYDYDPSEFFINDKIDIFFKRNYNKTQTYKKNVVPFPFIMFGEISLIEKCDRELVTKEEYFKNKIDRVFFSGSLFNHKDYQNNIFRNRNLIYEKICQTIFNPGYINYNIFLNLIRSSKYSLDLLGVGEPNKRTFEILLSGSLILIEKNDLKWPFEEEFFEETIFSDSNDYFIKLNNLNNDDNLYKKCLENQYNIVNKYFNKEWIKNYILNNLNLI
jgi:hypothetical protein